VASAFFMEQLDGSVIATSLPQIGQSFGVHAVDVGIGMTAYLVALASFIPLSGWVADRIGARTTFCAAIAAFAIISMICGVCTSLPAFIVARIAQGAAGAMMVPVGRTVVLRSSSKQELLRAISFITWPGLIAPVLGPPIGGFVTTYISWRWIFFFNLPLGIAGVLATLAFIRPFPPEPQRPFDLTGFLLTTATLVAAMFGLDELARGASPLGTAALLAGAVVLAVWCGWHLRSAAVPILNFKVGAIPTFAAATFRGGSFFRVTIQTAPFMLPLLFQVGMGKTAFASGLLMLAYAAGNLGMKTLTTPILRRFGFRTVVIANGCIVALSLVACAFISPAIPDAVVATILFASGLCRSMQYSTINTLGFVDVPQALMSAASTLSSTIIQVSAAAGIALGALLLHGAGALRNTGATPDLTDFHIAFALAAAIAMLATLSFLTLPKGAGAEVTSSARA